MAGQISRALIVAATVGLSSAALIPGAALADDAARISRLESDLNSSGRESTSRTGKSKGWKTNWAVVRTRRPSRGQR
jgi:hypothetical protein